MVVGAFRPTHPKKAGQILAKQKERKKIRKILKIVNK